MKKIFDQIEFFPKDKQRTLQEVFFVWALFGTLGIHQFYLGNKRRGWIIFCSFFLSHFLWFEVTRRELYPFFELWQKGYAILISIGYLIGIPMILWDLITMAKQVRKANGVNAL